MFTLDNLLSSNNVISNGGDLLTSAQISEITSLVVYGSQVLASPTLLAQQSLSQSTFSGAVQAAIWEVEDNEVGPGINNSLTVVSDDNGFTAANITTIENAAATYFLTADSGAHEIDTTSGIQNQAYDPKFQVPEPGTLPLFGLGIFALGLVLLRRKAALRASAAERRSPKKPRHQAGSGFRGDIACMRPRSRPVGFARCAAPQGGAAGQKMLPFAPARC